jgi:hypothetical protein
VPAQKSILRFCYQGGGKEMIPISAPRGKFEDLRLGAGAKVKYRINTEAFLLRLRNVHRLTDQVYVGNIGAFDLTGFVIIIGKLACPGHCEGVIRLEPGAQRYQMGHVINGIRAEGKDNILPAFEVWQEKLWPKFNAFIAM